MPVICFGCAIADAINEWGNPVANGVAGLVLLLIFAIVCIPQYFSVFKRSKPFAIAVRRISLLGTLVFIVVAVVYPIIEYNFDFSPPGFEILGAVFYGGIACIFAMNRMLHGRWIEMIDSAESE